MGGRLFTCLFAFQFEILISFSDTSSHSSLTTEMVLEVENDSAVQTK